MKKSFLLLLLLAVTLLAIAALAAAQRHLAAAGLQRSGQQVRRGTVLFPAQHQPVDVALGDLEHASVTAARRSACGGRCRSTAGSCGHVIPTFPTVTTASSTSRGQRNAVCEDCSVPAGAGQARAVSVSASS